VREAATTSRGASAAISPFPHVQGDVTVVVHSGDLDKVMAALVIATGAAAMGRHVALFFTFWGLNALKSGHQARGKNLLQRLVARMMPSGPQRLPSSRMNCLGLGPRMFRTLMHRSGVPSLAELIETAREQGVRFIACCMSMDLMGIDKSELIDDIEYGGVATYLAAAEKSGTNLFI